MLPRPSRLKSVASEFSPVLTTPPPVEPNTVLVLMSVPPMMLSSNLTVRRRRAAISAATPASAASAPPPITQPGVLPTISSISDDSFVGALAPRPWAPAPWPEAPPWAARRRAGTAAFGGSGAFVSGAGAAALGGSAFGGSAFAGSGALPCLRQHRRAGLALELERLLQILQRLFEIVDAGLRFLQRLVARHHLFRRGGSRRALARLRRHLELIAPRRRGRSLLFDGGADPAARGARACAFGRRRRARDLVLVAAPIGGLDADGLGRLRRRRCRGFLGAGNIEDRAGAQPVHVAVERGLVAVEERDQHLLERRAGRLVLAGDARQRVAAPHRVAAAGRAAAGARPLAAGAAMAGAAADARASAGADPGRRHRFDGRGGRHAGRIEQERVGADHATGGPVDLDQEIEIRLGRRWCPS